MRRKKINYMVLCQMHFLGLSCHTFQCKYRKWPWFNRLFSLCVLYPTSSWGRVDGSQMGGLTSTKHLAGNASLWGIQLPWKLKAFSTQPRRFNCAVLYHGSKFLHFPVGYQLKNQNMNIHSLIKKTAVMVSHRNIHIGISPSTILSQHIPWI